MNGARPLVTILTLGEPRRFLPRPVGGRTEVILAPVVGDPLVRGGSSQRTRQHSIPKAAAAGPPVSA